MKERITLEDSTATALMKMSDGNPGAIKVLMEILNKAERIDPQAAMPLRHIMALDTHQIYGSKIWILYKDACGQNITKVLGLLRACQLGFLKESELQDIATTGNITKDALDGLMQVVRNKLTGFTKEDIA